ncbi:MAG: hypothetical protein DHS20C01_05200 [marine bacterium B5-7]|nr:MAG: hypothetical protein DHS20C01_05200 [marine bacterium B5-7]
MTNPEENVIKANRLVEAMSPYLKQHADNPVHWQPWDACALAEAVKSDKPVLLSIGYSACHWCHVMAHESFEDPSTASLMNELYINIKVDREERPDLDQIYQIAHQMLTRRPGGWPLTVMLTPRGLTPFFAGTYFPSTARHNLPSFKQVLTDVATHYRENRTKMDDHDVVMHQHFARINQPAVDESAGYSPVLSSSWSTDELQSEILAAMDCKHGGFGRAPKFPHATALGLLLVLRDHNAPTTDDSDNLQLTLDAMALGGLFDQIGGGFFRYSVDDTFDIPHFEKMLYDNALLMPLYAAASIQFQNAEYRRVALATAKFVIKEMQLESGGFCSSLDADSAGGEGEYYVFSRGEIDQVLSGDELKLAIARFNLDRQANFEGRYHLNIRTSLVEATRTTGIEHSLTARIWDSLIDKLARYRDSRERPARDDKCLTSWNALMIKALARTGRLLDDDSLIIAAERALQYLRQHHIKENRLNAVSRNQESRLTGYLDDYVFLADALLELLQCRWQDEDFSLCESLVSTARKHFSDTTNGGFYFTADDHEVLLYRPITATDDSTPSGNGIAGQVLLELYHLTHNSIYQEDTSLLLSRFTKDTHRFPTAHGALLLAHHRLQTPETRIVLRGSEQARYTFERSIIDRYADNVRIYSIDARQETIVQLSSPGNVTDSITAFVCMGHHCHPPVSDLESLHIQLDKSLK